MEAFKKGFYTTSSKKERKPEANIGQSSFTQPQPFSQQSQQPEEQQNHEEWKQTRKSTHVLTPMSEEKPRKQAKSALHQKVSEFNPSDQMSMEQHIKVELNLQEEVKKPRKIMRSQCNNLTQQKEKSQDLCPRKESQALFETYHKVRIANLKISFRNRRNWITDSEKQKRNCQHLRKIKVKLELYKWKSKSKMSNKKENNQKSKRNVSSVEAFDIFIGSVGNSNRNNETIGQKNNKRRKEKKQE